MKIQSIKIFIVGIMKVSDTKILVKKISPLSAQFRTIEINENEFLTLSSLNLNPMTSYRPLKEITGNRNKDATKATVN